MGQGVAEEMVEVDDRKWWEHSPRTASQVPCCWQLDSHTEQPACPRQVATLTISPVSVIRPSSGLAHRLLPLDSSWIGSELIDHPETAN